MGFSTKKCAEKISNFASLLYFFIIIMQVPLFRFPCRIGTCQTPVQVMASASEILPEFVVKALLFPEAVKQSFTKGTNIPSTDQLLHPYKLKMGKPTHLRHLEVIVGSYLSVAGAILGLIRSGRMSYFGLTLILWGIAREMFAGKYASGSTKAPSLFPELIITMIVAFLSVRKDVRKIIKCCVAKRLKKMSKVKHR